MRFKELRGLFLGVLLAALDAGVMIYALVNHDKIKLIAALFLSVVVLLNLLTSFYVRVLNDCVFCYHFAGVAFLPKLIELKDIIQIEVKGKHQIILQTAQGCTHIYVWQAQKLQQAIIKNKEATNRA